MAVKILTIEEAEELHKRAAKYNESAVSLYGTAKQDYICDNSGVEIPKGTLCAAVAIHPSPKHHNYQSDVDRLGEYVNPA